MANATVQTETIRVVKSVTLTLSEDEALALHKVLGRVAGNPERSARGYVSTVYDALDMLEIDFSRKAEDRFKLEGNLRFTHGMDH